MFIAVPLFKRFNLGDVTLGIVGNASLMAKNATIGFSVHPELYYIGKYWKIGYINTIGESLRFLKRFGLIV